MGLWRIAPAALKNTAEPPGASAVSPNGVATESRAMEPTTSRPTLHPIRGANAQKGETVGEHLAHRPRQHEPRRLLGLAQDAGLVIPPLRDPGQAIEVAREAMRLERLRRARHQRSEEHTSELQSQPNLVCRLLLDKKTGDAHVAPLPAVPRIARAVRIEVDTPHRVNQPGRRINEPPGPLPLRRQRRLALPRKPGPL